MPPFVLYVCVTLTLNPGMQDTPTKVLAKFSVLICSIFFLYFKIKIFWDLLHLILEDLKSTQ